MRMPGRVGRAWITAVALTIVLSWAGFWVGGGLGAGIGAVAGGFASLLIERATRQKEVSEAGQRAVVGVRGYSPARLLDPEQGVVPFMGREAELATLEGWCARSEAGSLRLVTGGGGSGKTRLALELMRRMTARGWLCVRAEEGAEPGVIGDQRAARPSVPLLLVVDYAEARTGLDMLLRAAERVEGRVRVLLLARQAGDWWKRLQGGGAAVRDLIRGADGPVIELAGNLSAGVPAVDVVMGAVPFFAARLGVEPPDVGLVNVPGGAELRVLDLHAAALVAVLAAAGEGVGRRVRVDVGSVLEELLGHEKHYWRGRAEAAGLLGGPSGLSMADLSQVAAAGCLLGASSVTGLDGRVPGVAVTEAVALWLQELYPPEPGGEVSVLRPDRLAELHVSRELAASPALADACLKGLDPGQARRALVLLARASSERRPSDIGPGDRERAQGLPGPALRAEAVGTGGVRDRRDPAPPQSGTIRSSEIPPRNQYFTGRETSLELIRGNLSSPGGSHAQVIVGMGGIGKTELAAEYLHRNIAVYEIIWWIRAEYPDTVREALVQLAQQLGLPQAAPGSDRDRAIGAVMDWLGSATHSTWLLVYDNAANPPDLQGYLPAGRPGGHIIITSRQPNWPGHLSAEGIEVPPFTTQESVSFLRRKVPRLAAARPAQPQLTAEEDSRRVSEATRLATELGRLPLAVDHAAAYLAETGMSATEYLTRFARNAHLLLSENPGDGELPAPVSGTWAMSAGLLTPDAEHLFNLCAFFSPEPISAELFLQGTAGISDPAGVRDLLASPMRFRAAASLLRRLSLAKVDGARDLLQMHRVVQAVARGRLRQDRVAMYYAYRAAVDILLAESNPGNPHDSGNDAAYELSIQHLESDHRFLRTSNVALRGLIIDQVRRLRLRGAHAEATRFGQDALRIWRERLGEEHLDVLTMGVELATAMHIGGHSADAHELIMRTRPLLRRFDEGNGYQVLLSCESLYGGDLRSRSHHSEALALDLEILPKFEAAFGGDSERTLNVRNNIATDYRLLGRFQDALEADERTLEDRRRILGPNALMTLYSASAVARDLRDLGRFQESLDISRKAVNSFAAADSRENITWLYASEGFAIALRKAGHLWEALQESEHVLQRHRDFLGPDHTYALWSAANLINARCAVGDLDGAEELALQTRAACPGAGHRDDLLSAVLVNLATVFRATGRNEEALTIDDQARRMLTRLYGEQHPSTLAANMNHISDLAACGRSREAAQAGQELLVNLHSTRGDDHPDTLMAAANLAIDEATTGNQEAADQRLADVLRRYAETLTLEHPDARAAAQGIRLSAEIEALADYLT
jgi:tetratricopeptide (TPR) repeat protein